MVQIWWKPEKLTQRRKLWMNGCLDRKLLNAAFGHYLSLLHVTRK